jgi:ABC-type glycerol-3-phosphate transport system permease component
MNDNPMNATPDPAASSDGFSAQGIPLTSVAQQYLNQTRPWARFISIMIFIGAAFMVLAGLAMVMAGLIARETFQSLPGGGPILGLFYFALAVLYIAPGVFLSRYASAIKLLKSNRSAEVLEDALKQQKSFWRYMGILTVIGLILGVLMMVFAFIVGFSLFLRR